MFDQLCINRNNGDDDEEIMNFQYNYNAKDDQNIWQAHFEL